MKFLVTAPCSGYARGEMVAEVEAESKEALEALMEEDDWQEEFSFEFQETRNDMDTDWHDASICWVK